MSQEWDYPPRHREWQPEIKTVPARANQRPRFERLIEVNPPKRKTAWQWYVAQMKSDQPILSKILTTMLLFTFWGAIYLAIAGGAVFATLFVNGLFK